VGFVVKLISRFRHYLDFIHHLVKLYNEKRSDLEEQQLHLNVGLSKIAETVEQVEEMQKSLAVKSQVRVRYQKRFGKKIRCYLLRDYTVDRKFFASEVNDSKSCGGNF